MNRSQIVQQMAKALWSFVWLGGPPSRQIPAAAGKAADELANLYEAANGDTLTAIAHRARSYETGESPGAVLCLYAVYDPQDAPSTIRVPSFDIQIDGDTLIWEGDASHANPCCRHNGPAVEVLVIEDDPDIKKMYPRVIRKALPGAEVHVVDNYTAAIGYLESHDIALVVSDVDILGPRSGVDVFQWVEENRPNLIDRYIFVTGGNPQVKDLHYRYLEKPFTPGDLTDEIRSAMGTAAKAVAKPRTRAKSSAPPATRAKTVTGSVVKAAAPDLSVAAFGRIVNETAARIPSTPSANGDFELGRYGTGGRGDKVFISAIWRVLSRDPRFAGMTMQQFKRRLIDANREMAITLARADLVGAMDPTEVSESEIRDLGSEFHFVLDRSHRDEDARDDREARALANASVVLDTFDRLDRGNNYVLLYDMRLALPTLTRAEFDAAVNNLRRSKTLSLDSDDGRHVRLTEDERAGGIREAGSNLVYAQRHERRTHAAGHAGPPPTMRHTAHPSTPPRSTTHTGSPAGAPDVAHIAKLVNQQLPKVEAIPSPIRGDLGRFGDKVYISALWRDLSSDPRMSGVTEAQFKAALVAANRFGYLTLARGDVIGAMDPNEVRESEINDRGATFHFVLDPKYRRNPARRRASRDDEPDDLTEAEYRTLAAYQLPRPTAIVVTPEMAARLVLLRKVADMLSEDGRRILLAAIDTSIRTGRLDERAQESLDQWTDEDLRAL